MVWTNDREAGNSDKAGPWMAATTQPSYMRSGSMTHSPPSSALSRHLIDEEPPSDAYYTTWAGSLDEDHITAKMPSAASTPYASLHTIPSDSDYSAVEVCSTEYVTAELCVSEWSTEYVTAELCKSMSMRSMKSSIGPMPSKMEIGR